MRCSWNLIALFLFFLLSCTVRWLCWQEDALPVYHALLAVFLLWSICRFFRKNRTRYRRFPRPYRCAAPCMA